MTRDSANIFRHDFATKKVTQVTDLRDEFARAFSISPDGQSVVFERCKAADDDKTCDLWIAGTSGGKSPRLLVKNGLAPAWGR
jgi:Tol biopolymer transport system component